jgi:aromatic-L-amino-acid/L-tryptophan decarboxylase
VASDGGYRLRADELRRQLARDMAAGLVPVAVIASTGTTNTGAVDPLGEIADVCAEHDVWLHVDGSYGGPAVLLLDRYARTREALGRVDSLAMDPHKWLYAPVDAGLVLIRDRQLARDAFSLVPPYLRTDDDPDGVGGPVWFSEYGFDQTRPFRALKVWLLLKHLGVSGYRDLIARDIAMAERLASGVGDAPDLELLAHGLSVVCFRCRPVDWAGDDEALDALNRRVLSAVQLGGRAFLAGTTVDGAFALRACIVNPGTEAADVDALIAEVRAALSR